MKKAGLKCEPSKCEFLKTSIKYLGGIIDGEAVRPDPDSSFLGFANYYREFIRGHSELVETMNRLVKKSVDFVWNAEAQAAFDFTKEKLCSAPGLALLQKEGVFILDTDASDVAISGILHQKQEVDGKKQGRWSHLEGREFILRMDNMALKWLKTYSMSSDIVACWITILGGFKMKIEHRLWDKHFNADFLSKNTEFYEHRDKFDQSQPAVMPGFAFMDQKTYDEMETVPWLHKDGKQVHSKQALKQEPKSVEKKLRFLEKGKPADPESFPVAYQNEELADRGDAVLESEFLPLGAIETKALAILARQETANVPAVNRQEE